MDVAMREVSQPKTHALSHALSPSRTFTVNIKYGFSAVNTIGLTPEGPQLGPPGYEINLLYIAGLVALILGGAGPLSIDALRSRRRQRDLRAAA
jgi:putative oxidoreductase